MTAQIIENPPFALQVLPGVSAHEMAREYAEHVRAGLPVNAFPISGDRTATHKDRWAVHDRMFMHLDK